MVEAEADEPARERLFDVLMRRLEILAPYKDAVRSIMCSARRNPGLALALSESLRSKVLDALFGSEEEFEYSSTTTPEPSATNAAPVGSTS